MFSKMLDELVIGEDASLWKAIHAFADLHVLVSIYGC